MLILLKRVLYEPSKSHNQILTNYSITFGQHCFLIDLYNHVKDTQGQGNHVMYDCGAWFHIKFEGFVFLAFSEKAMY